MLTEGLQIGKETRQGCSLSLLLFFHAMEIFNSEISQDQNNRGLKVDGEEFKLKNYAYDVLLTTSNHQNLIQHVMDQIEKFGSSLVLKLL